MTSRWAGWHRPSVSCAAGRPSPLSAHRRERSPYPRHSGRRGAGSTAGSVCQHGVPYPRTVLSTDLGVWFYVGWAVVVAGVMVVVLSRPGGESTQLAAMGGAVRIRGDRRSLVYATGIGLGFCGLCVVLLATGGARDVLLWVCLALFAACVVALTVGVMVTKSHYVEFDRDGMTISQGARYRVRWDDLEGVTIHRESIVELHVATGADYVVDESARFRWWRSQFGGPHVAVMTNQLEGGFARFREEFTLALDAYEATLDG